jgi:tetratricopeptide (TPR) repeat protein
MKSVFVALTVLIVMIAVPFAAAQDATPEPPPICPAFESESADVRVGYYMGEALAYLDSNQLGAAEASLGCIIRVIDDSYVPAYLWRAEIFLARRDYEAAVADYNSVLDIDSNLITALNNRGIAYYIQGEYEEAAADFDRVIELNPDYFPSINNRVVLHTLLGEYEAALALIDTGIERAGLENALAEIRNPDRPTDAPPLELPDFSLELIALRGLIESARSLSSFQDYLTLASETELFPDERIASLTGSLESRFTFELRLDDGTWLIGSPVTE